jgi:gamma-glutamyl hydrolase
LIIFIYCQIVTFEKPMAESFPSLPEFIRNLIPSPDFTASNLDSLTPDLANIGPITNSIKTQTALALLNPPSLTECESPDTRPLILIFCQPSEEVAIDKTKVYPYAPVAYSNWLEATGARCIPLPYDTNEGTINYLLERTHGLLVPGGGCNLYKSFLHKEGYGPVMQGFLRIWRYILKMWAKGVEYPIWGTCLGLEIILLSLSGDSKVLSSLNSRGHQVELYSHYSNSRFLSQMPLHLRLKAEHLKLLNFQHSYGISVTKFLHTQKLTDQLKIVQISKDKDGKWFCSAM